eukprot:g40563.t1
MQGLDADTDASPSAAKRTTFHTFAATLCKSPVLKKLIEASDEGFDEKEPLFLDQDPVAFGIVLNYLRTGEKKIIQKSLETVLGYRCKHCRASDRYFYHTRLLCRNCDAGFASGDNYFETVLEYVDPCGPCVEYLMKYLMLQLPGDTQE